MGGGFFIADRLVGMLRPVTGAVTFFASTLWLGNPKANLNQPQNGHASDGFQQVGTVQLSAATVERMVMGLRRFQFLWAKFQRSGQFQLWECNGPNKTVQTHAHLQL